MKKSIALHLILALLGAALAASVMYTLTASRVTIDTIDGIRYYHLREEDLSEDFGDTYLFNNLFASAAEDVLRLSTIRTQIETDGVYDADKEIDVTAFAYRDRAGLPNDYITAVYRLGDLLQWGQSGFTYETRTFDARESANFLSPDTTYMHILTNSLSGGRGTYLNAQLDQNKAVTKEPANEAPVPGTYRVLRNRFRTVQGENVEDLVSDWSEYEQLALNIEHAANDLYRNYLEYTTDLSYYNASDSNLRYIITRTLGDKTESWSNDPALFTVQSEEDEDGLAAAEGGEDLPVRYPLDVLLRTVIDPDRPGTMRYIAYSKSEGAFYSNTRLSSGTVRGIMEDYRYSFPDDSQIIVFTDPDNLVVDDAFYEARQAVAAMNGQPVRGMMLPAVFAALFALVLVARLLMIGRSASSGTLSDRFLLPSELSLLLTVIFVAVPVLMLIRASVLYLPLNTLTEAGAALGFIAALACSLGLSDWARRLLTHSVVRESLLGRLTGRARRFELSPGDVLKTLAFSLLPFALLIAINILLPRWFGDRALPSVLVIDTIAAIFVIYRALGLERIRQGIHRIGNGAFSDKISESLLFGETLEMARGVNHLSDGIEEAVGVSLRDERLKADLITNVSHDIKTPLTSIINYVDLLKRENIEDETVRGYIRVLDEKSARLKQLTIDLVEASKISSGTITVEPVKLIVTELMRQMLGEYHERFEEAGLKVIFTSEDEDFAIFTDPRHLMRVIENLLNNVCKYALHGTRVYIDLTGEESAGEERISLSIKNVSKTELNFDAKELTERFIRGDLSRSTEGAGLGLSIAESLTRHLGGTFDIRLDGDLFKVTVTFPALSDGTDDTETRF